MTTTDTPARQRMYHSGLNGTISRFDEWDATPADPYASWPTNDARTRRLRMLRLKKISGPSIESRCPRKLVGKRCRGWGNCWCQSFDGTVNDHSGMYRHPDGKKVVFWEPYQIQGDALARIIAAAHDDGISVCVHGCSPYYPGHTLVLEFQKAAAT